MKKTFCDCCGTEITEQNNSACAPIQLACHLLEKLSLAQQHIKLIDGKVQPFSGRTVSLDLCLPCYNAIGGAAVNKLLEIKHKK